MQLLREEIGNTAGHFSVQQSSRVNSSSPCFVEQSVKHSLEGCGEWTNRETFRIAVSHCWKPLSPASICRTNRLWLTVLTAHCSLFIAHCSLLTANLDERREEYHSKCRFFHCAAAAHSPHHCNDLPQNSTTKGPSRAVVVVVVVWKELQQAHEESPNGMGIPKCFMNVHASYNVCKTLNHAYPANPTHQAVFTYLC